MTDFHPLSDGEAQEIINKALQSGSLKQRNVTLTGFTDSGKTCLLSHLFHKIPLHLTSTVEQSFRGLLHHISDVSLDPWELLSHRDILEFLAPCLPEVNVSSPATENAITSAQFSLSIPPLTVPSKHPKESSTDQTMAKSTSESKEDLSLVHMIDMGGQLELMETMPSIVYNANLLVLVLNLMYSLDEHPPILFHAKGVAYKRKMPSQYSTRQIIKKLVATLQAKRYFHKRGNLFRILVVATHRDCVIGDLDAQVEALNRELKKLLLPSCKEELILYSGSDQIAYILNLKNPDDQDKATLESIRSNISDINLETVIEMPGSFLIYEQNLLKYAEEMKRGILSLQECLLVGKQLEMKHEVAKAALVFFHRHNTFLYFRKVLPSLIFVKPHVLLNLVNAVVLLNYKVSSGIFHGLSDKFSLYLKEGIITEELLSHDELSGSFVPGLYEPWHAIKLLCHTFTLSLLNHENQKLKTSKISPQPTVRMEEYLMMCLLPSIPDQKLHQHIPSSSSTEITPLIVKFTGDCVPLGCFGKTISCLLSTYEWTVSRNEDNSPECLAHNIALLSCPTDALLLKVVLVDSSDHIEVYVDADKDVLNVLPEVRQKVLGAIGKVLDIMYLSEIDALPAVLCPCKKVYQSHPASLIEVKSEKFLYCPNTKLKVGSAHEKHAMWFGDNPIENGKFVVCKVDV